MRFAVCYYSLYGLWPDSLLLFFLASFSPCHHVPRRLCDASHLATRVSQIQTCVYVYQHHDGGRACSQRQPSSTHINKKSTKRSLSDLHNNTARLMGFPKQIDYGNLKIEDYVQPPSPRPIENNIRSPRQHQSSSTHQTAPSLPPSYKYPTMAAYEMEPLPDRIAVHTVMDDKRTDRTRSWIKNVILSIALGAFAVGTVFLAVLYGMYYSPPTSTRAEALELTNPYRNQDLSRGS